MAFLKNKLSWHGTTSPNTVMNNLHIVLLLCYYSPDFCSLLFSKMAFQPNQFILKQPPSSQPYKLYSSGTMSPIRIKLLFSGTKLAISNKLYSWGTISLIRNKLLFSGTKSPICNKLFYGGTKSSIRNRQ